MFSHKLRPAVRHMMLGSSLAAGLALSSTSALAQTVYVANAASNTVSVIDPRGNHTINVGTSPQWVVTSPDGSRVYTANSGDGTVSVIDASTLTVIKTIPVGDTPYGLAINSDGSLLYSANYGSDDISIIDTTTNTSIRTIYTEEDANPISISVSPINDNNIAVSYFGTDKVSIFYDSQLITSTIYAVPYNAYHVNFDLAGANVFVAGSHGTFTKINLSSQLSTSINAGNNTRTAIPVLGSSDIYLSDYTSGSIMRVTETGTLVSTLGTVTKPNAMMLSADGTKLYVVSYTTPGSYSIFNTASNSLIQTVTVGSNASSIAIGSTQTWNLQPAVIPTLTEWAMILLGLLLAGYAALTLQRRRQTA